MGNFDENFDITLRRQSWPLYAIGMAVILFRLYARSRKLGLVNLQLDDYLMTLVAGLYTALIVCLNVIADGGGSNLFTPGLETTFTPDEVQERIYGSKIVIISEQAMLNVIYTIKVCMLIMYSRLTLGLNDSRMVRWLAYYVAVGWVATEVAFFTACQPFSGYWAVPPPNPQCTTLENYAIVQACFNISSDMLMLGIPIPLVVRMRLPWRQKIVLVVIFSMGSFVILAALLTKIFNLTDVFDPSYMLWYTREASVAVYVSNLPMIWPLLREWFPLLRYLSPGYGRSSRSRGGPRLAAAAAAAAAAGAAAAASSSSAAGTGKNWYMSSSTTREVTTGRHAASFVSGGSRRGEHSVVAFDDDDGDQEEDDIELAMAEHGLGFHEDSDDDTRRLRPRLVRPRSRVAYQGRRAGSGPGAWPLVEPIQAGPPRLQSPPRVFGGAASDASDPGFAVFRIDQDPRNKVVKDRIHVHTMVEVREETAPSESVGEKKEALW